MGNLRFFGPLSYRVRGFATLNRIAVSTYIRHMFGQRIAPDWDAYTEIGIRFWRHQWRAAMTHPDISRGRLILNAVNTDTPDHYAVDTRDAPAASGLWHHPHNRHGNATLLYFHGGGYSFYGDFSRRFGAMLAHHTGADVFAPDYRLTPEHPHPAQAEDALAAWQHLSAQIPPERIVVIGDSAGGHMALMLLQQLKALGAAQPALCIGLCPWTDIGARGASLRDNDRYDLVQGWMALKFGEWLDPDGVYGREALSPIFHDFRGLCPIYIQVGGRDILRDMVVEFADRQTRTGADVTLDEWPDMPHDFQAYDSLKAASRAALQRITQRVRSIG